jgi:hypothetical protein
MSKIDSSEPKSGEIWHPYWLLEEFKSNMWGSVSDRNSWLKKAIEFTGNHNLYGEWMLKVVDQWPMSCEHNLSKAGDKRAWIGHAAVAIAIQCPEDIVRHAWSFLTNEQQNQANLKAEQAINYWKVKNA